MMNDFPRLTADGYELLFAINDAMDGEQIEADDLADAFDEAAERIGVGCKSCGRQVDTRFGWCYQCFMADLEALRGNLDPTEKLSNIDRFEGETDATR